MEKQPETETDLQTFTKIANDANLKTDFARCQAFKKARQKIEAQQVAGMSAREIVDKRYGTQDLTDLSEFSISLSSAMDMMNEYYHKNMASRDINTLSVEKFCKEHFPGIENETWYAAIVGIAQGFASACVAEKEILHSKQQQATYNEFQEALRCSDNQYQKLKAELESRQEVTDEEIEQKINQQGIPLNYDPMAYVAGFKKAMRTMFPDKN